MVTAVTARAGPRPRPRRPAKLPVLVTTAAVTLLLLLVLGPRGAAAVDRSKFRTCAQTHFCAKFRNAPAATRAHFEVSPASVQLAEDKAEVKFELADRRGPAGGALQGSLQFVLDPAIAAVPVARVQIRELFADPQDPKMRWTSDDILTAEADGRRAIRRVTAQEAGLQVDEKVLVFQPEDLPEGVKVAAALRLDPFGVDLYLNGEKVISTNDDQQFHYQIRRDRGGNVDDSPAEQKEQVDEHEGKTIVDYGEDGLAIYSDGTVQKKKTVVETEAVPSPPADDDKEGWEESFGGHSDKKKFGPSSIGLDVTFHGSARAPRGLYGIPEHASDFLLKNTLEDEDDGEAGKRKVLTDPYRLYNLDVFEHELDNPMALYGSIPVLVAPNAHNTVGMFWFNPTETFVDIETHEATGAKKSHWISESGVFDLFLFAGPTAADFFGQYASLTGHAPQPPMFAIAYHQCRWNYKNEEDVARVDAAFDEHLIPYDVIWLDIDHTIGKKYFTWDEHAFPTPLDMQANIARTGRKMVTIVDPHIKVSKPNDEYYIHKEAEELGLFIKDEQGKDFRGWCWPGDSSYLDFTSPKVRAWFSEQFRYENYKGSTKDLFTWNDMNEPSVFNGPEVSMRKGCVSLAGVEHREWHNLYGIYFQQSSMEGQLVRQLPAAKSPFEGDTASAITITSEMDRPFVLSRAFFAGSQRYGAVWSGDNTADWGFLKYATKMLLSMSVTGLSFVGADVGGFFGDPSPELLTRWYQAAIYQPFFRGHAHHDSPRREPWVHGEPHTSRLRSAIRERYALLPYLYTLFREFSAKGLPIMRPLWLHFPQQPQSFSEEDEFLLGEDLLIKPVVEAGVTQTSVFLPSTTSDPAQATVWYSVNENFKRYVGGQTYEAVPAPLDSIPVFQRGGSVLPRKNRVRRNSVLMASDPLTLVVALDANHEARGALYVDDERSFAAEVDGALTEVAFAATRDGLRARLASTKRFASPMWVERIEIVGFGGQQHVPQRMLVGGERPVEFSYDAAADRVVVRKPAVLVTDEWELRFEFAEATS